MAKLNLKVRLALTIPLINLATAINYSLHIFIAMFIIISMIIKILDFKY